MKANLLDSVVIKIVKKYQIDQKKAEQFALDLIKQIEAHGGNPENDVQLEMSIEVIVKRWIEKGY